MKKRFIPVVYDDKDSEIKPHEAFNSDDELNESTVSSEGADKNKDSRKKRIAMIIALAVCAVVCVFSLKNIMKKSDKVFQDNTIEDDSDEISEEIPEEIIPGLEEVIDFPELSEVGSPLACGGKMMISGKRSVSPYGSLSVYDPETSQLKIVSFLSRLPDDDSDVTYNSPLTDFCISDDGKYLFTILFQDLIKYDISTGEIVNTEYLDFYPGRPLKICPAGNSSDFYLIVSTGLVFQINDQLETVNIFDISGDFPEPESAADHDQNYLICDAVIDGNGCMYVLIAYDRSENNNDHILSVNRIEPDSEMILKYDTSFEMQYVIPNSELRKTGSFNPGLTVTHDGKAAVVGDDMFIGIISSDSPVMENVFEIPDHGMDFSRRYDMDSCDYVQYNDEEMQLWNIGDTTPVDIYKNVVGTGLESYIWADYYHLYNKKIYYISAPPISEFIMMNTDGTFEYYYNMFFRDNIPEYEANVNRNGELYYCLQSINEISFEPSLGFIKKSGNKTEVFPEYDCSNENIEHFNMFINADINLLSECSESGKRIMELHAPDGRKICDFERPEDMRKFLSSRSTDNGEKICYIGSDKKAYCYDTQTETTEEISVLNDNLVFYDEYEKASVENAENGIWLDISNIFKSEKYDICMRSAKKLFGYNIETEELTVLVDDLDTYDCFFNGFTVSEDGTIYCTVLGKTKIYRMAG